MYTTNASRGLPRHRSRHLTERYTRWAMRGVIAVLVIALLWLVLAFHLNGQWMFALLFLLLGGSLGVVFTKRSLMSHRYIFPAVAGLGVFVIFPLIYTFGISFSNYSSTNLLSEERVRSQLMSQTYQAEGNAFDLALYPKVIWYGSIWRALRASGSCLPHSIWPIRKTARLAFRPPMPHLHRKRWACGPLFKHGMPCKACGWSLQTAANCVWRACASLLR